MIIRFLIKLAKYLALTLTILSFIGFAFTNDLEYLIMGLSGDSFVYAFCLHARIEKLEEANK